MRITSRSLAFAIFLLVAYSFTIGALSSYSNSATVPINIKVNGKLIITDEASENSVSGDKSLITNINTDRSKKNFNIVDEYKLRVRSNVGKWRLVGNITEIPAGKKERINPKFIRLTYETSNGSKANPSSARLSNQFAIPVPLSIIPQGTDFTVLEGISKTSLERDKGNHNNWYGLTFRAEYVGTKGRASRTKPVYKKKKFNAIVSYTLVSL